MDGVIADCTHRLHFIEKDPKDWDSFFKAAINDKPIMPMIELLRSFHGRANIEIHTGRSTQIIHETIEWLSDHDVPYTSMKMRKMGDHRPAAEVKAEWIEGMGERLRSRVLFVLEDNPSCAEAYGEFNLPVLMPLYATEEVRYFQPTSEGFLLTQPNR